MPNTNVFRKGKVLILAGFIYSKKHLNSRNYSRLFNRGIVKNPKIESASKNGLTESEPD